MPNKKLLLRMLRLNGLIWLLQGCGTKYSGFSVSEQRRNATSAELRQVRVEVNCTPSCSENLTKQQESLIAVLQQVKPVSESMTQ
jgi:hypothetical protein